ncbi:MAG: AraC family transcriptional regulator [Allomuricauda sp.]
MKPMFESINLEANASLTINTYRNEDYCESAGWHIHPEYEMVYVKNGSGLLHIGHKKRTYSNGVLVFLGGNIPHADFGNKDYKDNLEVVIQFKKEFFEKKLAVFPELSNIKDLIKESRHILVFDSRTHQLFGKDFNCFCGLDNQGKLVKFLSILDELSKKGTYESLFDSISLDNFRKDEIQRLEETFNYVNNNYNKNISVSEIASQLGLTPNSFSRFFRKLTSRRFIDFVNEFRTVKAAELFSSANLTITDVMYRSGFNDASYFSRQFKKYQGTTPYNYLKSKD